MHVLLDLWGVLLDTTRMRPAYREALATLFHERFGGERAAWLKAHDIASEAYSRRAETADWDAGSWTEIAGRLDGDFVDGLLEAGGVAWRPADSVSFARDLDVTIMGSVDARFPDARGALERLRAAGHRVYAATQSTDSSTRGALAGAGMAAMIDRAFTGDSQGSLKSRSRYWVGILETLKVPPGLCVAVDDRLDYLEAASSAGLTALLVDRPGAQSQASLPSFVHATLRNLAGLPHFIDELARLGK